MKSFIKVYTINSTVQKVWDALTNSKVINAWGGGPAEMNDKENFKFSLWGGDIWGTNEKVVKNKLLKQEWNSGDWKAPSIVTFTLLEKNGVTTVDLNHKNIPDDEFEEIKSGWDDYYMNPLKELLESKSQGSTL